VAPSNDRDHRPAEDGPRFASTIALLVICGVLVLVAGGAAVFVLVMDDASEPVATIGTPRAGFDAVADARPRWRYTREEFRALVLGETRAEVAAAVGNEKHGVQPGPSEVWHFAGLTVNPETGKPDFNTAVTSSGDTATAVRFQTGPARVTPGL
jgi:hypothetical protein